MLQGTTQPSGLGKIKADGNNPMLDLGLGYFMSFDSFPYPKLLYEMSLRMSLYGYQVSGYKEHKKDEDPSQYSPIIFIDFSS